MDFFDGDLSKILQKKIEILQTILLLSQQQLAAADFTQIDQLFLKKKQQLDHYFSVDLLQNSWHQEYSREMKSVEEKLLFSIEKLLRLILDYEQKLENRFLQDREQVTVQLNQLSNREQLKQYLQPQASSSAHVRVKQ